MGIYVDSSTAYTLYKKETKKPYFVDKTMILKELLLLIEEGGDYICITRPRRFGKTVMANMIASFFCRICDASDIFDRLDIAKENVYTTCRRDYPVIYIPFNDVMGTYTTYEEYIRWFENQLIIDLRGVYPDVVPEDEGSAVSALLNIYAADNTAQFIFVMDEWDFIFHQPFITEEDKKKYLLFLRNLLKDRPYVLLAYMTGILPIAKYSSGSELNMFSEYTMASEEKYSQYFGFTEEETDELFARYQENMKGQEQSVTREGLRRWYDGYYVKSGVRLYNPRSVVMALSNNNLGNYWTSSGPYDEIYYYIENNVDEVRDDLALMISGIPVPAKNREYAAVSRNLRTKEEIFSAMVVYGFLSYEKGKVSIPNKELEGQFSNMLQREPSLGYVYRLAKESERMLQATLCGDTKTMEKILEQAHNTEVPLLNYNNEAELTAVVNLVYLAARDHYRVEREDRAGTGYVDFIFYPETDTLSDEVRSSRRDMNCGMPCGYKSADCMILELKVNHTAEEAVMQIRDKKYEMRFLGKTGENPRYTGRILGVGIGYDKKNKKHECVVEVLRERL